MRLHSTLLFMVILCLKSYSIEDLSKKSWSGAFDIVHTNVSLYYPFTEHKKLNLDSLYLITSKVIKKAEQENNETAYFLAMKQYAMAFHDSHCFAKRKGCDVFSDELSGHYGIEIVELDNGDMVVAQIRKGAVGLPEQIKTGSKIISWNNIPIEESVNKTSLLPADEIPANLQNSFLAKCKLLMFDPVGTQAKLTVVDMNGKTEGIILTANSARDLKPAKTYPKVTLWDHIAESPVGFSDFIFKMPENVAFGFFEGRSLNEEGNIQIDSDYRGIGGGNAGYKNSGNTRIN